MCLWHKYILSYLAISALFIVAFPSTVMAAWPDDKFSPISKTLGTTVYSNAGATDICGTSSKSEAELNHKKVYLGCKWQCVELVQRYYFEKYGYVNSAGNSASWGASHAIDLYSRVKNNNLPDGFTDLKAFPNEGISESNSPKVGDVIVFESHKENYGSGHVALVSSINGNTIEIAEQNYSDWKLEGARKLAIKNGKMHNGTEKSAQIVGWITTSRSPHTKSEISKTDNTLDYTGWKTFDNTTIEAFEVNGKKYTDDSIQKVRATDDWASFNLQEEKVYYSIQHPPNWKNSGAGTFTNEQGFIKLAEVVAPIELKAGQQCLDKPEDTNSPFFVRTISENPVEINGLKGKVRKSEVKDDGGNSFYLHDYCIQKGRYAALVRFNVYEEGKDSPEVFEKMITSFTILGNTPQKPSGTQSVLKIDGWKSFESRDLGLSFQYPPEFGEPSVNPQGNITSGSKDFEIRLNPKSSYGLSILIYPEKSRGHFWDGSTPIGGAVLIPPPFSIHKVIDSQKVGHDCTKDFFTSDNPVGEVAKNVQGSCKIEEVNGAKYMKISQLYAYGDTAKRYIFYKNSKWFEVNYFVSGSDSDPKTTFDQMVQTFQFL